ncbi:MAG: hypothetical protein JM58_00120 [Peptococcaceae bacterium BICA1-8]|nr:MAG: hypothetical protein JM58_00120 [Peptococcaceae bacterium BICA1-8]
MDEKSKEYTKSAKYRFEFAKNENEELEHKQEEFVRNVAQRHTGISAEREKFPDGVKTGSYKRLPPNRNEENR